MPCPRPIRRQFRRWSGVASTRRGNHASGAASSRPSASTTTMRSSVTWTSTAVASGLMAEVGIPCLEKRCAMFDHQSAQPIYLMRSEAARFRKAHRFKPELGHAITMLNMNVRWLRSLQAIEEEAIPGCSKDGWHRRTYDDRYAVL